MESLDLVASVSSQSWKTHRSITVLTTLKHRGRAGGDWRPHSSLGHSRSMMVWSPVLVGVVFLSVFSGPSGADHDMPKLADWKLCADEECSHPVSMAVAVQDYVAPDCRFLTIYRGQVVYVFSKLKGRGRLFWGGSVQGGYYGDLAARLGYFPSSIVREDLTLKPAKIDVKTDKWDFYCQ
ncbi:melanoma-derived growth regulatory protein isoform X2 [Peromyscus leucopus]|uniref:melanoma-derived growth regulatory protein isoform X2 n=2 Tax=Peromyscus leucopus TaxID=10041 RepID=UPI0010A1B0D2|nr:melanoma-derived growth regulatory protein isoform X2 [Peromyscus leucopus]